MKYSCIKGEKAARMFRITSQILAIILVICGCQKISKVDKVDNQRLSTIYGNWKVDSIRLKQENWIKFSDSVIQFTHPQDVAKNILDSAYNSMSLCFDTSSLFYKFESFLEDSLTDYYYNPETTKLGYFSKCQVGKGTFQIEGDTFLIKYKGLLDIEMKIKVIDTNHIIETDSQLSYYLKRIAAIPDTVAQYWDVNDTIYLFGDWGNFTLCKNHDILDVDSIKNGVFVFDLSNGPFLYFQYLPDTLHPQGVKFPFFFYCPNPDSLRLQNALIQDDIRSFSRIK